MDYVSINSLRGETLSGVRDDGERLVFLTESGYRYTISVQIVRAKGENDE